jgi:hypothetical protein
MRRSFRYFLLLGFSLLMIPAVAIQARDNGRITGSIRSLSGNPLKDAVIKIFQEPLLSESLFVTRTDSRGLFRSASLSPGTYYLQVSRQGYQGATERITIAPGRTTSLNLILEEFMGYVSKDDDPRNWDLKTVMRSSSDRRMILRDLPAVGLPGTDDGNALFSRSGAMSIASNTPIGDEIYQATPQSNQNGVSSNFAFAEPLSQHSRMILLGQLDFGNESFWRVRNTYNYRPDMDHDYKVSLGYGRTSVNYPGTSSLSPQFFSQDQASRDSAIETLAFGLEGNTRFLNLVAVKYGFDYSRFHYGAARSFLNPSIQITVTPLDGWAVKTTLTSQRITDQNSILLPDGEMLNLSEPTFLTMVGKQVSMSQVRHSEIATQKGINPETDVEIAVYQDRTQGPGLPLLMTTVTPTERTSRAVELGEDGSSQRGIRITINRKLLDFLGGSVAYVFGTTTDLSAIDQPVSSEQLYGNLISYTRRRNRHSLTGRLDARIPVTKTNLLATVRWYPGNSLTPIDWFSDRMDIGTKSTNLEIRQALPVPDFLGNGGRWEALVDLRNILDQGREIMPTTDGEIVLNRNPRSLRFGICLNFR